MSTLPIATVPQGTLERRTLGLRALTFRLFSSRSAVDVLFLSAAEGLDDLGGADGQAEHAGVVE